MNIYIFLYIDKLIGKAESTSYSPPSSSSALGVLMEMLETKPKGYQLPPSVLSPAATCPEKELWCCLLFPVQATLAHKV